MNDLFDPPPADPADAVSLSAYAERAFSVRITSPTVPLAIATQQLPSAVAGRAYDVSIVAVGGITLAIGLT